MKAREEVERRDEKMCDRVNLETLKRKRKSVDSVTIPPLVNTLPSLNGSTDSYV